MPASARLARFGQSPPYTFDGWSKKARYSTRFSAATSHIGHGSHVTTLQIPIFLSSPFPLIMGRRKRVLEDGDDSDSSNGSDAPNFGDFGDDPDTREERALFEDPYKRKRRKKGHKEDALYGIFAEDSDDEDVGKKRRSDWAKAPAFVRPGLRVFLLKKLRTVK